MRIKPEDFPIIARTMEPMIHPEVKAHLDNSEFAKEYWDGWQRLWATRHTRLVRDTIVEHIRKHPKVVQQVSALSKDAVVEPCWYIYHGYTIGVVRVAPDLVLVLIAIKNMIISAGGIFSQEVSELGELRTRNSIPYDVATFEADDKYAAEGLKSLAVFMGVAVPTFLEFAEVETVTLGGKPNVSKRYKADDEKYLNLIDIPVEIIDSRWFRKISSDKEFGVSGHFRLQPYGPGNAKRKLVYIADFVKHGYHRRATREKE